MTSRMDLMEHGGHGRLIEYHPKTGQARVVVRGLQFANGVAMTHDDRGVLIVETGSYQLVLWNRRRTSQGPQTCHWTISRLPRQRHSRPRRQILGRSRIEKEPDSRCSASRPILRKVAYRLPLWLQPQARSTGFVLGLDAQFELKTVLRGRSNGSLATRSVPWSIRQPFLFFQ